MPTCGNCGKTGASVAEIKKCYAFPPPVNQPPEPTITDGMWITHEGTIFKVQASQGYGGGKAGELYGKRLVVSSSGDPGDPDVSVGFVYQPGVPALLRRERARALTLAEAKEFGALYGVCACCGRVLTNETSIEAGIGPVCRSKLA